MAPNGHARDWHWEHWSHQLSGHGVLVFAYQEHDALLLWDLEHYTRRNLKITVLKRMEAVVI